jgi:glycosyltransferase involved in cell wall biosynthesis
MYATSDMASASTLVGTREIPSLDIALVTETYPPEVNGVAMTTGRLVHGLMRLGHHVSLVRPFQRRRESGIHSPYMSETLVPGMPLPRYAGLRIGLPAARRLQRLWSQRRPHLVHIVTEGPLGRSALVAARRLGVPATSGFHTNFHSYSKHYGMGMFKPAVAAYLRWFHNHTARTFVPTHELKFQLAQQGYQGLRVVARGVDTQLFSPARRSEQLRRTWDVDADNVAVLYVGRLAPEKNMPLVFETFERIRSVVPDARLVLVGDGPQRHDWQRRYPDHVFAGMRVGEDLACHYASGDVFLFPSLTETFGNVTLEAMASGLAVVAFDYAAAREHIQHGQSGMLAACDDRAGFAALGVQAAADAQLRAVLGAGARLTATNVSWDQVVDTFIDAIAELAINPVVTYA